MRIPGNINHTTIPSLSFRSKLFPFLPIGTNPTTILYFHCSKKMGFCQGGKAFARLSDKNTLTKIPT